MSALFFAVTFVLNRSMSLEGGSWIWSASFRYYWMALLLMPILLVRGELQPLLREMRKNMGYWILWSTVGFGIFYGGLTYASSFAPGWLVAGTWQLTILAGICLSPFISKSSTPLTASTIFFSLLILIGIIILQIPQARAVSLPELLKSVLPILAAAFAYPLGNRKMMQLVNGKLSTLQRIFGMTLASLPAWILLSVLGYSQQGFPDDSVLFQTFVVALSSGVIATGLFFKATELVRENEKNLAAIEATQSTEVIFALLGEILFLHATFPGTISLIGMAIVIIGMVLHSIRS